MDVGISKRPMNEASNAMPAAICVMVSAIIGDVAAGGGAAEYNRACPWAPHMHTELVSNVVAPVRGIKRTACTIPVRA